MADVGGDPRGVQGSVGGVMGKKRAHQPGHALGKQCLDQGGSPLVNSRHIILRGSV